MGLLSECSDGCGWTAALISIVSWGSFGVPIKKAANVEVHPLVMQSYKTMVCFVTSFLVVFLGEEVRWSNWGIASGLFWVPAAACGIYGIRNAGLAVAVGTWSSIVVMTSFFFGIVVFHERVKDLGATCVAFILLIIGLAGMSRYSEPQAHETSSPSAVITDLSARTRRSLAAKRSSLTEVSDNNLPSSTSGVTPLEIEPLVDDEAEIMNGVADKDRSHKDHVVLFGGRVAMTRRQLGVLGAVINGSWGGMCMIPLHYALRDDGMTGAGYTISFGGGAVIVNTIIWLLFYLYYLYQKKGQWREALDCLPSFHFEHLLVPGLAAGLLYSTGNFCSILAVTYLGQSTGFSATQMQLFVSGLWGVFYFHEVKGAEIIMKWFASAFVAVVGIVWLAYEHEGGSIGH